MTPSTGGVLWTGLIHKGTEGNPGEQKRMIVDRMVHWTMRDGWIPEAVPGHVESGCLPRGDRAGIGVMRGEAAPSPAGPDQDLARNELAATA